MAQEELDTEGEGKRRKSRRRRHGEPSARDDLAVDGRPQPGPDEFVKPADTAALREARLKAMATPTAARKKMKLEYQYSRPVRAPSTRAKTATPSGLFGRRSSVLAIRPRSRVSVPPKSTGKAGEYESVYQSKDANKSMVDRRDFQKEHDKALKSASKRPMPAAAKVEKSKLDRSKTEPAIRRSSTTASTRPALRKADAPPLRRSATSTTARPTVRKTATSKSPESQHDPLPPRAETVISTAKSTKSQRTSLLGSLFTKPSPPPEKLVSCLTCGSDDIPASKSARLPCSHRMCHSCLKRIFKMSIKDPAHMPPRCCTDDHIALKHVENLFDQEFKRTWNRKFKEYNAKNRIYCPRKGCGEWIQPKHMRVEQGRKIGVCSKCSLRVCGICNQKAHKSRDCPQDPSLKEFAELTKQRGWIKCYNCSATVELKEGCNHMTCRCTAEFCMVCGKKWKSCDCPWFNYDAVGDVNGDPIRYQQELDRRREQEQRDEEMARQMAGLDVRQRNRHARRAAEEFQVGNAAGHHMNADFLQQAREALAVNYQNAEVAARGLLGGWLTGRENPLPAGVPGALEEQTAQLQRQQLQPRLERRRTHRARHAPAQT